MARNHKTDPGGLKKRLDQCVWSKSTVTKGHKFLGDFELGNVPRGGHDFFWGGGAPGMMGMVVVEVLPDTQTEQAAAKFEGN